MNYEFDLIRDQDENPIENPSILHQRPFVAARRSLKNDAHLFQPGEELATAMNSALALGEPLLLTGEPGTGKTQAAYYLAYKLQLELIHFQVKSESIAKDLLYFYDNVRYFHDANMGSINALASLLREAPSPPKIVYVNCCYGDSAFNLGAGKQLGGLIPYVLTNRSEAFVAAGRKQGCEFWSQVINGEKAPHEAADHLYRARNRWGMDINDPRWMTPTQYRSYGDWKLPQRNFELDPDWRIKLDRVTQTSVAKYLVENMLERGGRCLCLRWCGGKSHGVEEFRERLEQEMRGLSEPGCLIIRPEWPPVPSRAAFAEMLQTQKYLEINDIRNLPTALRHHAKGAKERAVLVVSHAPICLKNEGASATLLEYLKWWDEVILPYLESRQHVVLSIVCERDDSADFQEKIHEQTSSFTSAFRQISFRPLSDLETIRYEDLLHFFEDLELQVFLSHEEQRRVIRAIMKRTNGCYESVVQELEVGLAGKFRSLLAEEI